MRRAALLLALFLNGWGPGGQPGLSADRVPGTPQTEPRSQSLRILTETLSDAVAGKPYRARLQAAGGHGPYRWNLDTPSLPEGLVLDQDTGEITGTPVSAQLNDFTIRVTDDGSPAQTARRYFTLTVADALAVQTGSLPRGVLRSSYRAQLAAAGGTGPLIWEVSRGSLPPGLNLNRSGRIAGTPTRAGTFRFTVQVSDAAQPPQTDGATFVLKTVPALAVEWNRPPRVTEGGLFGSVQVSNSTEDDFDLTVIVVAVNEYGKAFALGYRRFELKKNGTSEEIPFGFSLPRGEYVVHVDAVAEVAPKNAIYRDRQQQGPFLVE